jgi:hypothetical protein
VKAKQISLNDDEMPESVLVELSHDEALYVALLLGRQNDHAANEVMPGGALAVNAVYDGLAGGLFNRFYHDGVREAAAALQGRA